MEGLPNITHDALSICAPDADEKSLQLRGMHYIL